MNKLIYSCLISLLCLASCQSSDDSNLEALKGIWIGSAETTPYPELMMLSYDSVPHVQCFYRGVNLYIPPDLQLHKQQLSFSIDVKDFFGEFVGKMSGDTIKGIFQHPEGMAACNFVKAHQTSLESVGQLVGYYRLEDDHAIEVLPYTLSPELTALSITDFKTGKKRVAFPVGENRFAAGKKMLSPYPVDITFALAGTDNKQTPGIEYVDAGKLFKAKRMPDVEQFEDFEVQNGKVSLACTITYPNGEPDATYPLVIVVPGTGDVVRASAYNDYTKMLPWQEVAVLSYDKRGCGESTGDLDGASFEILAGDLMAVLEEAKRNPRIDAKRIGLAGFDQAGFVMPIVASKNSDLAFMVSIAGSALSVEAQEYLACELRMIADGYDEPTINKALQYEKMLFEFMRGKIDSVTFQKASDAVKKEPWSDRYTTSFDNKRYINRWRIIHHFDPMPYLKKVKVPIFVAYGEQDIICPPKYNFPLMKKVFEQNPHDSNQMIAFEGANHLIMLGEKRGDFQFSEIIGYAPDFIPSVNQWMLQHLGIDNASLPEAD